MYNIDLSKCNAIVVKQSNVRQIYNICIYNLRPGGPDVFAGVGFSPPGGGRDFYPHGRGQVFYSLGRGNFVSIRLR